MNEKSPTPETDAFSELKAVQHTNQLWIDFARSLEQQLAAAKDELKAMRGDLTASNTKRDRAQADCAAKDEALKCAEERLPEFSSVKKIIKQSLSLNSGAELLERLEKAESEIEKWKQRCDPSLDSLFRELEQLRKVADELAQRLSCYKMNGMHNYSQLPHVKKGKECTYTHNENY